MGKLFKKLRDELYAQSFFEQTIIIYSNREAVVENVKQVIESNEICIRLSTHLGETSIWGRNLVISYYSGSNVRITGDISSCDIQRRNKNA